MTNKAIKQQQPAASRDKGKGWKKPRAQQMHVAHEVPDPVTGRVTPKPKPSCSAGQAAKVVIL